jgi:antibiotic biosynthesis monooxygenase
MPIIRVGQGIVTQINVFTVPEGGQHRLIDHLAEAVTVARQTPGWLSASLHRSLDGTRIVNYAQSDSLQSAQSTIARLAEAGLLERNKAYGEAHPGLYEVVKTFER